MSWLRSRTANSSLWAFILALAFSPWARSEEAAVPAASVQPITQWEVTPTDGLRLEGVSQAAFSRARAGRPLVVRVRIANVAKQTQRCQLIVRSSLVPSLQSVTVVEIPGEQYKLFPIRLEMPTAVPASTKFDLNVSLNALSPDSRIIAGPDGLPLIDTMTMVLDTSPVMTGVLLDDEPPILPEWAWPGSLTFESYELVIASRIDSSLNRNVLTIGETLVLTELTDWDCLDSLVIARNEPLRDVVALQSLMRWVASGGNVWIMMDRIDHELLSGLLPDGASCHYLDDISLSEFTVDVPNIASMNQGDRHVQLDQPVKFRRVIQNGGTVTHLIDGFPIAIWYPYGQGKILVTTLEARGWVKRRTATEPSTRATSNRDQPIWTSDFQMHPWAQGLGEGFHEVRHRETPFDSVATEYTTKHIGNPVLDRRIVLGSLATFCGLLSVASVVCWATSRLVLLGWLIPLLSIIGAAPLAIAAMRSQHAIPDTAARLQIVNVTPGSKSFFVSEWMSNFAGDQASQAALNVTGDATAQLLPSKKPPSLALDVGAAPDNPPASSANEEPSESLQGPLDLRRIIWMDLHRWQITSAKWPHGLWTLRAQYGVPNRSMDVIGSLTPDGFKLQLPSELDEPLQDAVLEYVPGDIVPCGTLNNVTANGSVSTNVDSSFTVPETTRAIGQSWLSEQLVNDEQMRRDMIYQSLAKSKMIDRYPSYPCLMGWTKLWESPFQWNMPREERGSALVMLPVRLQPVASGTTVTVPHYLITTHSFIKPGVRSTAWDSDHGRWRDETTISTTVPLQFYLPEQVQPFQASEIVGEIQLRAPQREVRISSKASGEVLLEQVSPMTTFPFRSSDPKFLADAADGIIELQVHIGEDLTQTNVDFSSRVSAWTVDYCRIHVRGTVLPR